MLPVILIEGLFCLLAFALLVPVAVLFVQALSALRGPGLAETLSGRRPSVAVLIPAHNEQAGIATTLRDVMPQLETGDRLLVVADNCTDDTAKVASELGAEVLQRFDRERRGKGYALDFGLQHIGRSPTDAVVIVDADCRVDSGAIARLAHLCVAKKRPVQGVDLMLSPEGAGFGTRISEFAWLLKNFVRALGYKRLGLPCQLMGTGMAFPWEIVGSAGFATGHIVEDLKLGIDLARAGTPPLFCAEARVTSYFPSTSAGVAVQRTRWEHGHLGMIFGVAPALFVESLRRRNRDLLALSLDLCVPPLALLMLLSVLLFVSSAGFGVASNRWLALWLAVAPLLLLTSAVLMSWARYGRYVVSFSDLLLAPIYAIAKVPLYLKFVVRRQVEWVRARRDAD